MSGSTRFIARWTRFAAVSPHAAAPAPNERGALLMEAPVAVSVFTLLGSAVMTGMSASGSAAYSIETGATASNLSSNQMEIILASAYQDPPYAFTTITPPAGYTISATAKQFVQGDTNIAKIIVTVYRNAQLVTTLESLRLKEPG
jgi:hypothetical protein